MMDRQKYDLSTFRKNYTGKIIRPTDTPFELFAKWFDEAIRTESGEANAMVLATVDEQNHPHARMVLLKSFTDDGFVFFTNYQSNKGRHIEHNRVVSLLFFWQRLQRQVRISGTAKKILPSLSDEYFYSRPIESQHAAMISKQSGVLSSRNKLLKEYRQSLKHNKAIRPEHWGGYCVLPFYFEFWQGMPSRLHDRLVYEFDNNCWNIYRLYP